jgi:hypothetical protein
VERNPRKGELGYELALLYTTLSEKDSAIAWTGRHLSGPFSDPFFFRVPLFDSVKNDPRFQAALKEALKGR